MKYSVCLVCVAKSKRGEPSFVIWAIAFASMLGSALQALDALMDGAPGKVALWSFGAVIAFVLAFLIERYKGKRR
jgi:hypothetical protein